MLRLSHSVGAFEVKENVDASHGSADHKRKSAAKVMERVKRRNEAAF